MAVPSLVLAIVVVAILGPSLANTIVAVTIVYLPRYVRVARASALGELGKDYVTAARVAGVGPLRLALSTVLPNCLAPLIVQAALGVSDAILEAAGARLSRPRRAAADAGMGRDARRFARIHPLRPLDRRAARPRDPDHRRRDQPDRRRIARRARPEDAEGERCRCSRSAISPSPSPPATARSRRSMASTSTVDRDEVLAIVGKSGSGKSVAMLAVMGLLPPTATVSADRMALRRRRPADDAGRGAPRARRHATWR